MPRRRSSLGLIVWVLVLSAVFVFCTVIVRALVYAPDTEVPVSQFNTVERVTLPGDYPVRLEIPSLEIDADVQHVGINADGNMANPSNFTDVGWYKYGPAPGENGSAVLAGHVDNGLGLSGIFKHLDSVSPGDDIYVTTEAGNTLRFEVVSVRSYPYNETPAEIVFNPGGQPRLNLITCAGNWLAQEKTYDERLVVSARFVP